MLKFMSKSQEVLQKCHVLQSQAINILTNDQKNCLAKKDPFQELIKKNVHLSEAKVQTLIDECVKSNDVIVFMKGTPDKPSCGFSNHVIQILKKHKIKNYTAVNILTNDTLRTGVKSYSDWPTYPQLYIKGELVGGRDIIVEMHQDGSFADLLEEKEIKF